MTPLTMLLYIQETLPPPPEPTSSPDINTAQVIGIVILSLGLIVIAALAVRPLVGRKAMAQVPDAEPEPPEEMAAPVVETAVHRPIIQFPAPATRTPEPPDDWHESNLVIEERFGRVLGDTANRRKLGDRRPTRRAHDLALAALHRLDADPQPRNGSRAAALADRPGVPLDERRLSAIERVPHGQILQWQGAATPQAMDERIEEQPVTALTVEESFSRWPANHVAASPADEPAGTAAAEPAMAGDATEEFAIVRRTPPSSGPSRLEFAKSDYGLDIEGVDTRTIAEISQVLRDLIYCANSGQFFHGFALYSDPYLFRFMDGTGLTEDEFREVYGSIGSRPSEQWERLDRLSDVVRTPDGKIEATVSYVDVNGKPINGRERFRFDFDRERRVWMIDDIDALGD